MADLRERLEDLAGRFPEREGMDGLDRSRRRRQLRSRVLAGSLALLIAAVGTASAYLAFRGTRPPVADQPPAIPDTLRIECDGTTAHVLTPKVRVRPDGVRLEVTNTASFETWTVLSLSSGSGGSPIVPAGQTKTSVTTQLIPGESDVWCGPSREDVNDDPVEDHLEIVDPDGVWVSDQLDCPSGRGVGGSWSGTGEPGMGSPEDQVRERYANKIREGDNLDRAGYPEADDEWGIDVRLTREGRVTATFHFFGNPTDGWYHDSYSACQEF